MADLYLEKLTKKFGEFVAVDNLNLKVESGNLVCLLGPSGCGKSTTLNMTSGLLPPTSGDIYINKVKVTHMPPQKRGIGLVFQNYALFGHMTVYENLAFGLKIRKTPDADIKREVKNIAQFLKIDDILNVKSAKLRLDEMQRVAIGRSLVTKPEIFLMDEPLSNLDAALRSVMRVELKKLQKGTGQTIIYVTHDQIEAMTIADKIAIMSQGKLQQYGTPDEIYSRPSNKFVAGFIGSPPMNFINCTFEGDGGPYLNIGATKINVSQYQELIRKQASGSELILGFRAEDVDIKAKKTNDEEFETRVTLIEPLGNENILILDFQGLILKVSVPVSAKFNIRDRVWIKVKKDKLHLIDRETENLII